MEREMTQNSQHSIEGEQSWRTGTHHLKTYSVVITVQCCVGADTQINGTEGEAQILHPSHNLTQNWSGT
jgi:hypothetical protein